MHVNMMLVFNLIINNKLYKKNYNTAVGLFPVQITYILNRGLYLVG